MIFSKDIIEKIIKMQFSEEEKNSDDLAISRFLIQEGVNLRFQSRSNISFNHIFYPNPIIRCKTSSNNELTSKRFVLIDKYFKSKSLTRKFKAYFEIQLKEIQFGF